MVLNESQTKLTRIVGAGRLLWCGALPWQQALPPEKRATRCRPCTSHERYDGYVDPNCLWSRPEVLYDGCAGSGKTFYDLVQIHFLLTKYPNVRILGLRETLKSMRESVQVIFEDHILGPDHPALKHGGGRANRDHYDYPRDPERPEILGGGHFMLGGLDRPDLYLSSEWDLVFFFEATNPRIREWHWSKFGHRLRGVGIPHPHGQYPSGVMEDGRAVIDVLRETKRFNKRVVDRGVLREVGQDDFGFPLFFTQQRAECNPSDIEGESHWLWKRFKAGLIARLEARHSDNPTIREDYLQRLRSLPEPARSVYYEGKWTSAQGRVWGTYQPNVHLVRGEFTFNPSSGSRYVTIADWLDDTGRPKSFSIASVTAGFDWGKTSASTLQVFAKTADNISFRIAQIYRAGPQYTLPWWAERVAQLVKKFQLERIWCDPNAVGAWDVFNMHLAREHKDIGPIAGPADNTRNSKDGMQGGLDLVDSLFAQNRLYLFTDCHFDDYIDGGVDRDLARVHLPTGWEEEVPNYIWARDKDDLTKMLHYPDDDCIDHGCDASRYNLVMEYFAERKVTLKPAFQPMPDPWVVRRGVDIEAEDREREIVRRGNLNQVRPSLRGRRS